MANSFSSSVLSCSTDYSVQQPPCALCHWEGAGALGMVCWLDWDHRSLPGTAWHVGTSPCTAHLQGLTFPMQCQVADCHLTEPRPSPLQPALAQTTLKILN